MKLKDKTVVMTAAGNGIGREVALEFGRRGAQVVVSDRDGAAAERVALEIVSAGGRASGIACDVSNDDAVSDLVGAARQFGPVDVLMNHAGVAAAGPVDAIPLDDWRWVFEVNILGIARTLKAFLPGMAARRSGLIINTSSSLGLFPEVPVALPYISTKAGIIAMTEALALSCREVGIRVMVLAPDITETGFHFAGRLSGLDPATAAAAIPLNLQRPPREVADVLFAAIDDGTFLATNVPNAAALLRARADALYEPQLRAYPQLAPAIQAFGKVAA